MNSISSAIVLMRKDWRIEINPKMWSAILLYLSKRGWQPSFPTHYLLAESLDVSKEDADSMAKAAQAVLDESIANPLSVYTVPFEMSKLAEIVVFCEEGGFRICR